MMYVKAPERAPFFLTSLYWQRKQDRAASPAARRREDHHAGCNASVEARLKRAFTTKAIEAKTDSKAAIQARNGAIKDVVSLALILPVVVAGMDLSAATISRVGLLGDRVDDSIVERVADSEV